MDLCTGGGGGNVGGCQRGEEDLSHGLTRSQYGSLPSVVTWLLPEEEAVVAGRGRSTARFDVYDSWKEWTQEQIDAAVEKVQLWKTVMLHYNHTGEQDSVRHIMQGMRSAYKRAFSKNISMAHVPDVCVVPVQCNKSWHVLQMLNNDTPHNISSLVTWATTCSQALTQVRILKSHF